MLSESMNISSDAVKFLLEAQDPATECIVAETSFETDEVAKLIRIVDPDATLEDFKNGRVYELEADDIEQIFTQFSIEPLSAEFDPSRHSIWIRLAHWIDELPYKLHTNRELTMMLAGTKPLAYFYDVYPPSPNFQLPEHLFDPYVEAGRFLKREYVCLSSDPNARDEAIKGTRVVLYALKHEAWRLDAFALVQNTAEKTGWNESIERIVGSLLGYEEWQNDAYIEHLKRRRAKWL